MGVQGAIDGWRTSLASFLGYSHNRKRNLYEQFGYDRLILPEQLFAMYSRNDIANRIIRAFPSATWRQVPVIRDEAGDSAEPGKAAYSPFVEAVENFFEDRKLWQHLERADRLASIGRFGVLFMGFRDGTDPRNPLPSGKHPLLFVSPYAERNTTVHKWVTDINNPRYGLPELYTLQTGGDINGGPAAPRTSITVHHSRVVHIAEFLDEDDTYGMPRLLPVFNRLLDLEKVVGGSAETFWLTANRGLALWADKEAQLQPEDVDAMGKQAEELQHNLRRYIVGSGFQAQVLGSESPDPEPNATILLDLISGAVGIPKRILIGSERGELSSTQDENNWAARIDERRKSFAGPVMLRRFVQVLLATGNLPAPKGKWWIEWPESAAASPLDQANVALAKSNTLRNYVSTPGAEFIVPVQEFRTDFLGLPPESEYEAPDLMEPEALPEPDPEQMETEETEALPAPAIAANAKPRTLYISRPVLNAEAILAWARKQGLKKLVSASELHVTLAHSRAQIDWMKVPSAAGWGFAGEAEKLIIPKGGARLVEPLGASALVLLFRNEALEWRHQAIRDAGASWDFPEYQPHITLTYDAAANRRLNLDKVKPWRGQIVLGPEIFEEVE